MRIGYAQFEPKMGDYEANLNAIARLCAEGLDADLLVFPELAVSGYDFADKETAQGSAEPFDDGPTSQAIRELAAQHEMTIVVGYPERAPEGLYNSAMLCTPDGTLHNYRKMHLFSRETLFFLPGNAAPPVIETPAGRVGLMICFDWIFPETARLLALNGAQIIAHPSNLVLTYCQRAMYCRSVENKVFIVTANRTGVETTGGRILTFTGASQILSPHGEYLIQAPEDGEHVGLVEIDPSDANDKQMNEHNNLWLDRRVELYEDLL